MTDATPRLVAIDLDAAVGRLVEVHWIITRRCQYSCWYCPPHRHDPKSQHAEGPELLRALARIIEYLDHVPARINLTGGEPTLHPGMPCFVAAALAAESVQFVRVVSNLAGPLALFKRLAIIHLRDPGLQVVASFHAERAQVGPFMERVSVLADAGVPVLIKVLRGGDEDEAATALVDELRRRGLPPHVDLMVQAIRQSISDATSSAGPVESETLRRWNDSRIARLSSGESLPLNAEGIIRQRANRFRDWTCEVGSNSLFIDADGSFHAALCRPHGAPLANVFDQDEQLPVIPSIRCPHAACGCASTVRIPKRAPESTTERKAEGRVEGPEDQVARR